MITSDADLAQAARCRGCETALAIPGQCDFEPATTGFSVHYPHIFTGEFLKRHRKIYNLHPSYLPWGRGYYPVFWSVWANEPAGATLHEIEPGIDTGPIVEQIQVEACETDTGGSLHERVRKAEQTLFLRWWPTISGGEEPASHPQAGTGSYHSKKQFFEWKKPTDWRSLSAEELVRLARALTFPGYSGLVIDLGPGAVEIRAETMS